MPLDPIDTQPNVLLRAAERVSDEVLAPSRRDVDRSGAIPDSHFAALVEVGLFGAAVTETASDFNRLVEILARGCLATTFVWLQHHTLARRLASPDTPDHLGDLAAALRSGRTRAGIVQAGLLPGAPVLTARRDGATPDPATQGWLLDGFSPWCTGWGMVDELLIAARVADDLDTVSWFLVGAEAQPGLEVRDLPLQAVDATATVSLVFDGMAVPAPRFLGTDDYLEVGHFAGRGLRGNGSLALGLAERCARLIADVPNDDAMDRARRLVEQTDQVRTALDAAGDDEMPERRASAGLLAVDAAVALVAAQGAAAAMQGSEGEQAMREATFLLVFGSRPSIKRELLRRS